MQVGLVQTNNSFSGQNYLPYSVAIPQAYAQKYRKNPAQFGFLYQFTEGVPLKMQRVGSGHIKRTFIEGVFSHLLES